MKDQLDSLLLTQSLLDDFKVRAGVSAFGGGKERAVCLRETASLPAGSWVCFLHFKKRRSGKILTQHIARGRQGVGCCQGLRSRGRWPLNKVLGEQSRPLRQCSPSSWVTTRLGFRPQGYLGCQALSEMIQFYLEEVMPQAENHGPDIKEHVNSLGEKLKTLRLRLRRCVSSRPALAPLGSS